MSSRIANRLRRRGRRAGGKMQPIGAKDLDTMRVVGTEKPPSIPVNTIITRRTRLVFTLTAAANSYNVSTNSISLSDASDYATGSNLRFSQVRVSRIEAWASLGTLTGYTSAPVLHVSDAMFSGAFFHDSINPGVDYGHVAIRPSLLGRSTWRASNDTATLSNIAVEGLAGTTGNGSLYVDITFEAN